MQQQCKATVGRDINSPPFQLGDKLPRSEVYAVSCAGYVKIGISDDVSRRVRSLNTGSPFPIEFIASARAGRGVERAIHVSLEKFRVRGEWFEDCSQVREVVALIRAGKISELSTRQAPRRKVDPNVAWASEMLRNVAAHRLADEGISDVIGRVAERLGFTRWRTFDLWYRKARRLEISERDAIAAELASVAS